MGTNIAKMLAVLFSVFVLLNVCNDTPDNSGTPDNPNTPDNTDDPERFQVYDEDGTPFNETCVLVGSPLIPYSIRHIEEEPDYMFSPGTSTGGVGVYPWTVGKINNGKIAIGFPDEKLELGSDFDYGFTEGVRICIVYIEHENSRSMKFSLRKRNTGDYNMDTYDSSEVYIYYSSADFNRPHNGIALKAGWNFIEQLKNPNWFIGSAEPYNIIGSTSQDVNDFLKKGYRWMLERWT